MNKYLTILLVLLTATGSEAQVLTSALTTGDGSMKFEEIFSPEQFRALGSDIMSVLKSIQLKADNDNSNHPFYNHKYFLTVPSCAECLEKTSNHRVWSKPKVTKLPFTVSSVSIRAPSIA